MKLLIVDDSQVIRNKIKRSVLDEFSAVYRAEDGAAAIKIVQIERPELVTMDLTMPEMDGVECIQQIMALAPKTRILVVSALNDKETAIKALNYGANGFLCKPFSEQELSEAIHKVIALRFA